MVSDNELKKAKEEISNLKKTLRETIEDKKKAQTIAQNAILNHVRQLAINNMLWDIVDFALYGKEFTIQIPEKETEEERAIRILKENIVKGSLSRMNAM